VRRKLNSSVILILSAFIFITACTSPVIDPTLIERTPAESESPIFEELFTVVSEGVAGKENNKAMADQSLKFSKVNIEYVPSKELTAKKPFKIELDVVKGEYVYRIYHSSTAFKDKTATIAMINFVQSLGGQNNQGALYEIFYNAKNEDPIALKYFYGLRKDYAEMSADLEKAINVEVKKLRAWQKLESEKRKVPLAALDKAAEDKQFRTLVAKGDRKGAAKLLKTYLPWEMMAPFERQYWETYLEVMANPVPLEERVLIYRGLEGDFIHSGIVKGVALSQKEAIMTDNAFVMSTVLVKNQGSWNRRLRSLEAMYGKTISHAAYTEDDLVSAARIATMFNNHSGDPMGSPFLSFSPSLDVANSFGYGRVSAFLVDPRMLNFNYSSGFTHEYEYLVNLTTFPEDLVAILDRELHGLDSYNVDQKRKLFEEKLIAKIEKEYGKTKADAVITKIKKNSFTFFSDKMTKMPPVTGASPGTSNIKFYKSLGKESFKPDLGPKGELQCKDIIKLLWISN